MTYRERIDEAWKDAFGAAGVPEGGRCVVEEEGEVSRYVIADSEGECVDATAANSSSKHIFFESDWVQPLIFNMLHPQSADAPRLRLLPPSLRQF